MALNNIPIIQCNKQLSGPVLKFNFSHNVPTPKLFCGGSVGLLWSTRYNACCSHCRTVCTWWARTRYRAVVKVVCVHAYSLVGLLDHISDSSVLCFMVLSVCVSVCARVCVCRCAHVCACQCVCRCAHVCACQCVCVCMHTCVHRCVHVCVSGHVGRVRGRERKNVTPNS